MADPYAEFKTPASTQGANTPVATVNPYDEFKSPVMQAATQVQQNPNFGTRVGNRILQNLNIPAQLNALKGGINEALANPKLRTGGRLPEVWQSLKQNYSDPANIVGDVFGAEMGGDIAQLVGRQSPQRPQLPAAQPQQALPPTPAPKPTLPSGTWQLAGPPIEPAAVPEGEYMRRTPSQTEADIRRLPPATPEIAQHEANMRARSAQAQVERQKLGPLGLQSDQPTYTTPPSPSQKAVGYYEKYGKVQVSPQVEKQLAAKPNPYASKSAPKMENVQSTNINKVGHDGSNMWVEYKSGQVYRYKDVPKDVFQQAKGADSVGSYIARNVKGKYETSLRGTVKNP